MKRIVTILFLITSVTAFSQRTLRSLPQKLSAALTDTLPVQSGTTQVYPLQRIYNLFFPGATTQYIKGDGSLGTFPTSNSAFSNGAGYLLPADITGKQNTITLTTTGTSGAATLAGGTLNIPNYATGGSSTTDASQLTSGTLADARLSGNVALNLTPTAIKTAAYTAAVNDFVKTDATSGTVPITLPTAPADKARIAVKMIGVSGTNTTTIAAGGSAVFNKAGGSTSISLSLLNQGLIFQYESATGIWSVISGDIPLSGLDARFALPTKLTDIAASTLTVSSASTLTLAYANDYVFSGTTATYTLPAIDGTKTGRYYSINIKNRGTGAITINTASGSTLYGNSAVATYTLFPGEAIELINDGTYNNIK